MRRADVRRQVSDNRWRLGERFELFGQLGTGAAGAIWRARDLRDGSECAVRVLRPELVSDPQAVAALYGVLDTVARIGHPGIVAADDAATGEGWLALRSRLVAGESVRSILTRQGALDPGTCAHAVAQVCDALAAAQACGVAHGDLHPGNVLLGAAAGGSVDALVTDFGLSGLLNRSQVVVPPIAYRAPESVTVGYGAGAAAADVYAVGVLLYECLTGQSRPAPGPGLPAALWSIVMACTSGDPRHRPAAAQIAAALRGFAGTDGDTGAASSGARTYQSPMPYQPSGVPGAPPQAPQPDEAMTTLLPNLGAGLGAGPGAAPMPAAVEHTSVLGAMPDFRAGSTPPYPPPAGSGHDQSRGLRLPGLITAHKTESGIAAAVVVVGLLIGAALSLGGAGASASTASTGPVKSSAPAAGTSDTPEAVVLPPGSASPSPSASASPSATAPVQVTFVNAHSNTCMDTAGRIFANGTTEDVWSCNGTPAQVWTLTPAGQLTEDGGAYCLDDYGLEKTPGTRVVLWSCNGGPNQRWTIGPNGAIVSANAGLCIDVSGGGTQDGAPLVLQPCDGAPSQQWGAR